jgi:hypothetical protein
MTWARFDDSLNEHPKVAALNHEEFHLWASAIILASRQLYTLPEAEPGFLSAAQISALARQRGCRSRAIGGVVRQGLFEQLDDGGIQIHDFEDYLAPDWEAKRQRLQQLSKNRRVAGQKGGQQSVVARRAAFGTAQPKQPPKQTSEFASGARQQVAEANAEANPKHPYPYPYTRSDRTSAKRTRKAAEEALDTSLIDRQFAARRQVSGPNGFAAMAEELVE